MKSTKHYSYMLRCSDNSIYSGYAVDPFKREKVHNSGKGAKYTRARLPVQLVYYEEFESKSEALKREREFKKYTHSQKEKIILNKKMDCKKVPQESARKGRSINCKMQEMDRPLFKVLSVSCILQFMLRPFLALSCGTFFHLILIFN